MGGKRPANEYVFAPMYRRIRIKKRRVVSSAYVYGVVIDNSTCFTLRENSGG
jgi:hypothetical protein